MREHKGRRPCTKLTAAGKPCKAWAVEGTLPPVCTAHLGRVGRPTLLTPETADLIVSAVRSGSYVSVACRAVGIHPTTFDKWMQRGAVETDGPHHDLHERIERARAEGEARSVALIAKAATESWQAAAWLLERQYPDRWARRPREQAPSAAPPPPADTPSAPDPFSEVDDLAQRRRARL